MPNVSPPQQLSDLRPISITQSYRAVSRDFSLSITFSGRTNLWHKRPVRFPTKGSTTSAVIHFLVMLLCSWSTTPLLGAFCRLQQGFWYGLSRNLTSKTGQFQQLLPTIRYYLAGTVPHWSNSVRWSLNISPNYPFHNTRLWHWSICIPGYDSGS